MAKEAADLAPLTIPPKLMPDIAGNVDEEHSILKIFSNVEEEEARGRQSDESLERKIEREEGDGDGDGDYEFSFVCGQTKSPISADDIFQNGRIRPLFQVLGHGDGEDSNSEPVIAGASSADEKKMRSLSMPAIRKVFVERTDLPSTSEEKDVAQNESSAPAPEVCKKSNSTGFSKLFRLKEMLLRSYSDGKDAFVFLESKGKEEPTSSQKKSSAASGGSGSGSGSGSSIKGGKGKAKAKAKDETTSEKRRTSSSYGMNMTTQYGKRKGGKEGEKRRSYLPYKQDLVGFFTNVNGMSRNLHPY